MTYLSLYFKDRQRPCPIKNIPDCFFFNPRLFYHVRAVILICVLLVFCVLSCHSLNQQLCQAVRLIAGSKTKTRNIPLRGVSLTFIGQINLFYLLSTVAGWFLKKIKNKNTHTSLLCPASLAPNPLNEMGHGGLSFAVQRSLKISSIRFDPAGRPFGTKE